MPKALCIDTTKLRVYLRPDELAEPSNELLYGEEVEILVQQKGGWAKIKSLHDGYEGYSLLSGLKTRAPKTHIISAPQTLLYGTPDFKTSAIQTLYFLSRICTTEKRANGFVQMASGLWVFEKHLSVIGIQQSGPLETALSFIGAPYLWGGRSVSGVDCSGLMQLSLMAAGIPCPRDTGQQEQALGAAIDASERQAGDLVFYKGHVGILVSPDKILNATSRSMDARIENLDALERHYGAPTAIKRIIPE